MAPDFFGAFNGLENNKVWKDKCFKSIAIMV
jgi:hypothetical protein